MRQAMRRLPITDRVTFLPPVSKGRSRKMAASTSGPASSCLVPRQLLRTGVEGDLSTEGRKEQEASSPLRRFTASSGGRAGEPVAENRLDRKPSGTVDIDREGESV